MKKSIFYSIAVVALSFFAFAFTGSDAGYVNIGDPAPEIILKSDKGFFKKKKLSKLKGKIVLIKFWASWCLPCRQFSQDWVNIYQENKNKKFSNGKGFEVYSISLDEDKSAWKKANQKDGYPWKANTIDTKAWDSPIAFIYGINALPAEFLIDGNGEVIAKHVTPYQLRALLEEMEK